MFKDIRLNPHLLAVLTHVGGKPIEQGQEEYSSSDVIKFGSNENLIGPSPLAVAVFQSALTWRLRMTNWRIFKTLSNRYSASVLFAQLLSVVLQILHLNQF